jgi:hypothetical protein
MAETPGKTQRSLAAQEGEPSPTNIDPPRRPDMKKARARAATIHDDSGLTKTLVRLTKPTSISADTNVWPVSASTALCSHRASLSPSSSSLLFTRMLLPSRAAAAYFPLSARLRSTFRRGRSQSTTTFSDVGHAPIDCTARIKSSSAARSARWDGPRASCVCGVHPQSGARRQTQTSDVSVNLTVRCAASTLVCASPPETEKSFKYSEPYPPPPGGDVPVRTHLKCAREVREVVGVEDDACRLIRRWPYNG